MDPKSKLQLILPVPNETTILLKKQWLLPRGHRGVDGQRGSGF